MNDEALRRITVSPVLDPKTRGEAFKSIENYLLTLTREEGVRTLIAWLPDRQLMGLAEAIRSVEESKRKLHSGLSYEERI